MEPLPQGWALPPHARRWHFCIGRDALCRLWILPPGTPLVATVPDGARQCALCTLRRMSRRAGAKREEETC